MKPNILFLILPFLFLTPIQTQVYTKKPDKGFWDMEGNLLTHPFPDKIDSLSGQEIYELQDERGITVWFGREIFKDVCMTGECKMIELWLFWDGVGNYLGIQLTDNNPLTKSDNTEFDFADYKKLDNVLSNPSSILRNLEPADLTIEEESNKLKGVDGITSATDPGLEHITVKGAIYTCHTLWHTVYGHTRDKIISLLDKRVNQEYLRLLFENENPVYQKWAINYINNNPEYHKEFYEIIANMIQSDNPRISQHALDYFQPGQLTDTAEQSFLLSVLREVDQHRKQEIIWRFVALENTDSEVVLKLLELFAEQNIGIGALNPIFQLIHPEHYTDKRIESILNRLASNENAFVRSQTEKLIKEITMQ